MSKRKWRRLLDRPSGLLGTDSETPTSISTIILTMPDKQYIPFNLAPLNRTNDNEICVVTDQPFGFISATVDR